MTNLAGRSVPLGLALGIALLLTSSAYACSRAVYLGPENTIVTVRSMDWATEIGSHLWAFPRGIKRDGACGPKSITWTSKYGSVIATAFDAATADGRGGGRSAQGGVLRVTHTNLVVA